MAISGFLGRRNISRVDVVLAPPAEIYANREFPLRVIVSNRTGIFPAFLIRVQAADRNILFPFIAKQGEEGRLLQMTLALRGLHDMGAISVSSVFPFNFFTRYRFLETATEVVVFPEPKSCDLSVMAEKGREWRGESGRDTLGYEAEILSIREYIQGDPFKYINWKATAKTGELKTKELSSLSHQPVIIEMERVAIRDLEQKVSCVTYAVLTLLRRGIPVGLSIEGNKHMPDLTDAHRLRLLKELALYGHQRA
ncbi:MAG: DUF58 domain-containing protein [Thermodesulfovibrionales bacterium]|jgi:uncharacterized protein (DUF58 family)